MDSTTRRKIDRFQDSLSTLRKVAGWSAQYLAQQLDISRQTITNLENSKNVHMTKIQYMAFRLLFEVEAESNSNKTLSKMLTLLVDYENLDKKKRAEIKQTVENATHRVGHRAGAAVASNAAIIELIPILSSIALTSLIVGSTISTFFDMVSGKETKIEIKRSDYK